jgi:hypothetical protein
MWWGTFDFDSKFDWGRDYERPQHKLKDLIIYEMTVRCFTASKSSGLSQDKRGTYLGVAEKVRLSFGLEAAVLGSCWMEVRACQGVACVLLIFCKQALNTVISEMRRKFGGGLNTTQQGCRRRRFAQSPQNRSRRPTLCQQPLLAVLV